MEQFNPRQMVTNSGRTKRATKKLHIKANSIQRSWRGCESKIRTI